ncbi:MAG: hypothetical protein ABI629_08810 [bacterium]
MSSSDLRLADLDGTKTASKLMNVKVPENVSEAIDALAAELGCPKTAVVVALLNEGLDALAEKRDEFPAKRARK